MHFIRRITFIISLMAVNSVLAFYSNTDPIALSYARAASKELSLQDISSILTHPTLQSCMQQLVSEAKMHDRNSKGLESAVWIIRNSENSYSCHFWSESLRVSGGFDWDGFLPRQTVFFIHTHPKKSAGPLPSQSDFKFNKNLGMIGLILSFKKKVISVNYPGSRRYPLVMKSRAFKRAFSHYY